MNTVTIKSTPLKGLVIVEPVVHSDDRGAFCRTVCSREFKAAGLPGLFLQSSSSYNKKRGTLRGLHFQAAADGAGISAAEEGKLVRCTRGAVFDVAVDIRPNSETFGQWHSIELSADNRLALYLPPGFAHGFQSLEDNCEVLYQITVEYAPGRQHGIHWNDPAIGIIWPVPNPILSPRDLTLPELKKFN